MIVTTLNIEHMHKYLSMYVRKMIYGVDRGEGRWFHIRHFFVGVAVPQLRLSFSMAKAFWLM